MTGDEAGQISQGVPRMSITIAADRPTTTVADGRITAGRKGIPFDWQGLEAAAGVERIEADLRDHGLPAAAV